MTFLPLKGERVLDFTGFPPGALCTVMLADLGAEVVRVESSAQRGEQSTVFGQMAMSRGKRSIAMDLRNGRAAHMLDRLFRHADIIVENARPGAMAARGFGYPQAKAANPRNIWCAITGFGQDGPNADHAGHDISYLAQSGLLAAITPDRDFVPNIGIALSLGAAMAVTAIQSAVIHRDRTGEGAFLDISLSDVGIWALGAGMNPLSEQSSPCEPSADRRLYSCADGRCIALACPERRTWSALCSCLNRPDLEDKLHDRRHDHETAAILARTFATKPALDWVNELAPSGVAITIVNRADELLSDAHVAARGSITYVDGSPVPSNPLRITSSSGQRSATNVEKPRPVGDDTDAILSRAGFRSDEVIELRKSGLV